MEGRDDERVKLLNDIIIGISRRNAHKIKDMSVDDISQTLWVKVLEKENRLDDNADLNLIAKICYDAIVDIIRKESVRRRRRAEYDREYGRIDSGYTKVVDKSLVEGVLSIYDEGSKEKEYILLMIEQMNCGVRRSENQVSKALGFSSSSSGAYRSFRNSIRKEVSKYLERKKQ